MRRFFNWAKMKRRRWFHVLPRMRKRRKLKSKIFNRARFEYDLFFDEQDACDAALKQEPQNYINALHHRKLAVEAWSRLEDELVLLRKVRQGDLSVS